MKIQIDKYPMGSFKLQKTPGRYFNEFLYENLKLPAHHIVNDMTFLGIIFSSTLEVRTGKSTFAQQIGEAYYELLEKEHGIKREMTMDNILFTPENFIERAFKLPKYSFIILDEWEDAHYWSELAMTLKKFFQKCGQLNLFMIIIIPNLFELPKKYAISRSLFAVDVHFANNLERGYFKFYNYEAKKELYKRGKQYENYKAFPPSFFGRFTKGYAVNEEEYRAAKLKDMKEEEEEEKKLTPREVKRQIVLNFAKKFPNITLNEISSMFEVPIGTLKTWSATQKAGETLANKGFKGSSGTFIFNNTILDNKHQKNIENKDEND